MYEMTGVTNVKAVVFDLDDTLVRSKTDYKKMKISIIKLLVKAGVDPSLLNENMLNYELLRVAVEDMRKKKISERTIKKIVSEANAIMNRVELESLEDAELMEGALEVLSRLKKRGIKIGIITNGCRDYAVSVAGRLSLDRYIDAIVARDEVSAPKPNPEHLLTILKILGVSVEEAVFVGDHQIDASCARDAGVRFILLKSRNKHRHFGNFDRMEFELIEDLRDLLNII